MTEPGPGIGAEEVSRYALGHSTDELERLETQARIVDPVTRRFWTAAGVVPGMRVLDVGCGAGHTTVLLADMVGEHGQVVGIDNAARAVAAAKALSQGHENVNIVHGDANGVASHPPVPTFDRLAGWNTEVTRRYGANPNFGSCLHATFITAGLAKPLLLAESIYGQGSDAADVLHQVRNLARSLLAEMERFGVATSDQVGIDTVLDRMMAEVLTANSIVVGHLQVGVYSVQL